MSKTILITGSTDGIGKLTATKLAKEGHTVYVHGRNPEKLSATISEIKAATGNENVEGFVADLSDLDSVRQMAEQIAQDVPKIDVLINNAGVFKSPVADNKDGLDLRLFVNYLAPYMLTDKLMPLLKKGAEPRIVNLSSAAQSPVSLDVLSGKAKSSQGETYAQSKLALTMWSFRLAKTVPDVAVIAVNPGSMLNTKMALEAYGQSRLSADEAVDILYDLAMSEKYKGVTGKYFDNDKGTFGQAHPDAYNAVKIDRLINLTDELLN